MACAEKMAQPLPPPVLICIISGIWCVQPFLASPHTRYFLRARNYVVDIISTALHIPTSCQPAAAGAVIFCPCDCAPESAHDERRIYVKISISTRPSQSLRFRCVALPPGFGQDRLRKSFWSRGCVCCVLYGTYLYPRRKKKSKEDSRPRPEITSYTPHIELRFFFSYRFWLSLTSPPPSAPQRPHNHHHHHRNQHQHSKSRPISSPSSFVYPLPLFDFRRI